MAKAGETMLKLVLLAKRVDRSISVGCLNEGAFRAAAA
jgi:hypothetical protein